VSNSDHIEAEAVSGLRELPAGHSMHRVGIVVFCEAPGYDDGDAAAVAKMAISATLRKAGEADPTFPTASKPTCATCGAPAKVSKQGLVKAHHSGEAGLIEDEEGEPPVPPCEGSRKAPHVPAEPVLKVEYRNGHIMETRIFDTVEVGVAAGNGYLWTKPTVRAFR
jgi:hypothetical protein